MRRLAIAAALLSALPLQAQAQAPETILGAPDPARLASARKLIDLVMPPAERDRMMDSMMESMFAGMAPSMDQSPEMKALFARNPKAKAVFDRHMAQIMLTATQMMRAGLPSMIDAMSRAYARRLSVAELEETAAFMTTRAGQAYVKAAPTIMNDPDVAAWMRDHMQRTMAELPAQIEAMMKELRAPAKDKR